MLRSHRVRRGRATPRCRRGWRQSAGVAARSSRRETRADSSHRWGAARVDTAPLRTIPPARNRSTRRGSCAGESSRLPLLQLCDLIQRLIFASSTSSGMAPSFSTSSWNAFTSNFLPSAFSARFRSSTILSWPILYASAWPGMAANVPLRKWRASLRRANSRTCSRASAGASSPCNGCRCRSRDGSRATTRRRAHRSAPRDPCRYPSRSRGTRRTAPTLRYRRYLSRSGGTSATAKLALQ